MSAGPRRGGGPAPPPGMSPGFDADGSAASRWAGRNGRRCQRRPRGFAAVSRHATPAPHGCDSRGCNRPRSRGREFPVGRPRPGRCYMVAALPAASLPACFPWANPARRLDRAGSLSSPQGRSSTRAGVLRAQWTTHTLLLGSDFGPDPSNKDESSLAAPTSSFRAFPIRSRPDIYRWRSSSD